MRHIRTKLTLAMSVVAALVLTFTGIALMLNITVDYRRDFYADVKPILQSGTLNADNAAAAFESEQLSDKNCYLFKDGNIVMSTSGGGSVKETDNLRSLLSGGECSETELTDGVLDYGIYLGDGCGVYVTDTKAGLYSQIRGLSWQLAQALALGILLAVLISWLLSSRLTRSIKTLEAGAMRMADGDFSPIRLDTRDEIGSLCSVLNRMGEQIQRDYDEFEREEERRREFVANVSHELKTPITVIKSYSQTLTGMDVDADTRKQFLEIIDGEADRMSGAVSQLLELSAQTRASTLPPEHIDLVSLCRSVADGLNSKGLDISISGEGVVERDPSRVRTIVTNIIGNAIKYTEQGGVDITVCGSVLKVRDSGIGISTDDIPHIFERFYRADKARGRGTGGTGLGLAIAKECADVIGARISVVSELSEYTEFTVEF